MTSASKGYISSANGMTLGAGQFFVCPIADRENVSFKISPYFAFLFGNARHRNDTLSLLSYERTPSEQYNFPLGVRVCLSSLETFDL